MPVYLRYIAYRRTTNVLERLQQGMKAFSDLTDGAEASDGKDDAAAYIVPAEERGVTLEERQVPGVKRRSKRELRNAREASSTCCSSMR
jgi:hypothetical protein